jgi:Mg2+/Co2+ transporter CorB
MTNIQLYLAIGIPIIAVLTSLTVSMLQISGIRSDMRGFRAESREDLHGIRAEFREDLRGIRAGLREDMLAIRADLREDMLAIRADLSALTGKVVEIDNRLTRIEERLEHR